MTAPIADPARGLGDGARVAIGRVMSVVALVMGVTGLAWAVALGQSDRLYSDWVIHNFIAAFGFGIIGLLLVSKQPRNGVVWVSIWAALATGLYCLAMAIVYHGLEVSGITGEFFDLRPSDVPLRVALPANLSSWLYVPGIYLPLTLGFLLFADGRLPSRRWEWARWTAVIGIAGTSAILAYAFRPSSTLAYRNASEVEPGAYTEALGTFLTGAYWTLSFMAFFPVVAGVAALVVRYRRGNDVERKQFLLVIWGASVLVASLIPAVIWDTIAGTSALSRIGLTVGLTVLIASYGVAIAKYRLYDVDVVVSRTLMLGMLAAFITIVYALVVVGIGRLVGTAGDGLVLPILATSIVAVAFEPVRDRAQRWANRLVYGRRASPYEVLSDLTERLSDSEEGAGILRRMAERLGDGTGAARATIWLGNEGSMNVGASWPDGPEPDSNLDLSAMHVFPVTSDGVTVGAFEVVKPRGSVLSTAERTLITDLAGSAGAVLGYQRLNDSLANKAGELAESRARLVDAQDAERRRLERDLHDGAQQLIVALKVKIGLARRLAAQHDAADLERLLAGLSDEAQAALEDVRALAKGIYPPVLESDGLGPAISALASGAPIDVLVDRDGIGRYGRDVEAAVYFDVSEAVTNAVKHGTAPIRVHLGEEEGVLRFSVSDSGPGFDVNSARRGSGLQNLRDRIDAVGGELEIVSVIGAGTTIRGEIPLRPALV